MTELLYLSIVEELLDLECAVAPEVPEENGAENLAEDCTEHDTIEKRIVVPLLDSHDVEVCGWLAQLFQQRLVAVLDVGFQGLVGKDDRVDDGKVGIDR